MQFGELHYGHLERNRMLALQANKGHYDGPMSLRTKSKLHWWMTKATIAFKNIMDTNPDLTLTTDASTTRWGQSVKGNILKGFGVLKRNVPTSII